VPLYEYECKSCGHHFEKIVKFSDPPHTTCPKCNHEGVQQVISAPAVQFKGSGWYVTDYAKKSSKSGSSDGKIEASKSETKSETKPESAPKPSGNEK
jgi:putative FmdB family regulatory protein